jgi:hypothetical protein
MDLPKGLLDFLVYLAPSLLVFLTAWMLIQRFLDREMKLKLVEAKAALQKDILPLRLQAYERLTIYLERISPNVMLVNLHHPELTVRDFQQVLTDSIRTEFEHNFAQQIYVSGPIWTVVRNTKEEVTRLINTAAASLNPDEPAYLLSKRVFDMMLEQESFPTQNALSILKAEVAHLFT